MHLTPFERAIIDDIIADYRDEFPALPAILSDLHVTSRENTGGGLLVYFRTVIGVPSLQPHGGLGHRLYQVNEVPIPFGTVLLLPEGRPHVLDVHLFGVFDTEEIDFATATLRPWVD